MAVNSKGGGQEAMGDQTFSTAFPAVSPEGSQKQKTEQNK